MNRKVNFNPYDVNGQYGAGFDPSAFGPNQGVGGHGHSHDGAAHGHSHNANSGPRHREQDESNEEEKGVVCTLSELVPGAALRNLLVRVREVKEGGEAVVESAHGSCILMYDVANLSVIVRVGAALRITDGFGFTRENGQLVIGLEEPETESVVVEMIEDDDEVTPPPEIATRDISSVERCYGLFVIRENRCLLCPAAYAEGKFAFALSEADGDEPERTAALRAFEAITEIDVNEVYLLHDVPPVVSYEEDMVSTLFIAYSRRPFKQGVPPTNTEAYSWFTFDEAMEALDTDASKACLSRIVGVLSPAIDAGYVKEHYGVRFGPSSTSLTVSSSLPNSTSTAKKSLAKQQKPASKYSNEDDDLEAVLARTSALFYLRETNAIDAKSFSRLLSKRPQEECEEDHSVASVSLKPAPIKPEQDQEIEETNVRRVQSQGGAIPVTVLCGFLGTGKTTLVNHLMTNKLGMKIALVVNDMAEVNIDAQRIANQSTQQVVELTNGCICCTLREDLLTEIRKLAETGRFDCIVVESTGIGDPMGIAETFTFALGDGRVLNDIARLDTMVTVVDSSSLLMDMHLKGKNTEDESGKLSKLLTEQIEFADVIVLNKIDLVTVDEITKVRAIVSSMNPRARKIECIRSAVALNDVVNTGLFSFNNAEAAPGWLKTLRGDEVPESEEFGISSVIWRAKVPISPSKLSMCLIQPPFCDKVIRSKGIVWLGNAVGATNSVEWAGSGHSYQFLMGKPWASVGGKITGVSEVVLIGFFDDKSVSDMAVSMLNECFIPVDAQGNWSVEADGPIHVIEE